jgi:mannose-6-phosphate isomerase-like protein (cupin superfamily)
MTDEPAKQRKVVIAANKGRRLSALGMSVTLKSISQDTGGAFGVMEATLPPHFHGIPPYRHVCTTEAFYILEGTLAFTLDEETFTAGRGSFVLVPPHTVYEFWNPTASAATCLVLFAPAGLEAYWEELAAALANGPIDSTRFIEIAARHDQFPPPVPASVP